MKTILSLIAAALTLVAIGGCNTVEGIGKDVKKGGEVIEKAAK